MREVLPLRGGGSQRHRGDLGGHGTIMEVMHGGGEIPLSVVRLCHAPLLEQCPQYHGHKGDLRVTPGIGGALGERAQVILVWVRAPGRWERLPPTETKSHKG